MLILRSLVYNVVFYLNLAFWLLVTIPTYPFPPHVMVAVARLWGRTSIWLMRVICGTHVEILRAARHAAELVRAAGSARS